MQNWQRMGLCVEDEVTERKDLHMGLVSVTVMCSRPMAVKYDTAYLLRTEEQEQVLQSFSDEE